ncbi:hypothetical protein F4777DRAFT_139056 [Nemania sp. FL0916]|nr:hypothetical protein F4777DRAFT_139056 [Nemania sp. FL0916]
MQFSTTAIVAILSGTSVFAAPAAIPNWTVAGIKRVCNAGDTSCTWTFGINPNTGAAVTPCTFVIKGAPASHSDLTNKAACGTYSVTAGWSGQFGPNNGFTTLAVYNNANHQIAWPAYTDAELANGAVVTPDKSWAVTQM